MANDNVIYTDPSETNPDKLYGEVVSYKNEKGTQTPYPRTAQGPAKPATAAQIQLDEGLGFTNPNLHRRIKPQAEATVGEYEYTGRTYQLMVQGKNSYRTTTMHVHDEESTTSEIP